MIYLRYAFQKARVPVPTSVALFAEPVDWIEMQVRAEFETLFPGAAVRVVTDERPAPADLLVLVYRRTRAGLPERLVWGKQHVAQAAQTLAFYCVDKRHLAVVPAGEFGGWARRQQWLARSSRWRDRLIDMVR
jgi:hypothetical protein